VIVAVEPVERPTDAKVADEKRWDEEHRCGHAPI
jgi:hypothetical protein